MIKFVSVPRREAEQALKPISSIGIAIHLRISIFVSMTHGETEQALRLVYSIGIALDLRISISNKISVAIDDDIMPSHPQSVLACYDQCP
jgi:hypothetical protein